MRENTTRITGINNPREIIRWAFNKDTKVGDISSIFDLEDMYVIAVLTKSVEKGLPDYNDLIDRYEFMIKKTKKGEMLAEKAKAYGTDYQKMIDELGGEKTAIDNITFDGRAFGNFGVEDKIIGTVTALTEKTALWVRSKVLRLCMWLKLILILQQRKLIIMIISLRKELLCIRTPSLTAALTEHLEKMLR